MWEWGGGLLAVHVAGRKGVGGGGVTAGDCPLFLGGEGFLNGILLGLCQAGDAGLEDCCISLQKKDNFLL